VKGYFHRLMMTAIEEQTLYIFNNKHLRYFQRKYVNLILTIYSTSCLGLSLAALLALGRNGLFLRLSSTTIVIER
jgi:hypothetical protein